MAFIYYKDHIKEWLKNNKMEKEIILVVAFDLLMVVSDIGKL